jgi:hypothetical protein
MHGAPPSPAGGMYAWNETGAFVGKAMDGIYVVGLTLLGMMAFAVYALFKIAQDSDRNARHAEKKLIPYSDVTVTELSRER